jgi:toxin ParE1/3/4
LKVIWTEGAADDLADIVQHIRKDNQSAAERVAKVIFDEIMSLRTMPNRGRKRSTDSSRELVFARWSYLALYEVIGDIVYIKSIRHTSRDWSES